MTALPTLFGSVTPEILPRGFEGPWASEAS